MNKQVSVSIPELDDLLAEGLPAKGAPAQDQDLEISLDELLAESLEQAREEKEAKAVAERRKRGGTLSEEDLARIRAWEAKHEWKPMANVALFDKTTCNGCGRQQTIFTALLQRQEHRHLKDAMRWTAVESVDPKLPNEVAVKKYRAGMCTNCCERAGFTFNVVKEWQE